MKSRADVAESGVGCYQSTPPAQDRRRERLVRNNIQWMVGMAIAVGIGMTTASATTEETVRTNLPALAAGQLVIDLDACAVEITTHNRPEIRLEAVRTARGRGAAREGEILAQSPVRFRQDSNTWTITALGDPSNPPLLDGARPNLSGLFRLWIPAEFTVSIKTRAGSIHVADVKGKVRAETGGGGLRFSKITGDVTGETASGPVQIDGCVGICKVVTRGGGIQVDGGSGSLQVETSGGTILVRQFRGVVRAETDGGGIRFVKIAGAIVGLTGSGSVAAEFDQPPAGPVRLETSGGGITLKIPRTAGFDLDALTSAGSVLLGLGKPTGESAPTEARKEKVNGGGPEIRLRTGAGSIRIIGTDPVPARTETRLP